MVVLTTRIGSITDRRTGCGKAAMLQHPRTLTDGYTSSWPPTDRSSLGRKRILSCDSNARCNQIRSSASPKRGC
jgi:hypothetical protein